MTALLEQAMQKVALLGEAEQDHLAVSILAVINEADRGWDERFASSLPEIEVMADEALEEHRQGRTLPIDLGGV